MQASAPRFALSLFTILSRPILGSKFGKIVKTRFHQANAAIAIVRNGATLAILGPLGRVRIMPPARLTQCVQRAIAKQTVETLDWNARMAREVIALRVLEEQVFVDSLWRHADPCPSSQTLFQTASIIANPVRFL